MRNRIFVLTLLLGSCVVLVSCSSIKKLLAKPDEPTITVVVDGRYLGGRVYPETVNQLLTAIPQHYTIVKVLHLGNRPGSAYRAQVASFSLPPQFNCEEELMKDAPFNVKLKQKERDEYIETHKGQCLQKQAQYNTALNDQMGKLRRALLDLPDSRECISLAVIGERLAREAAATPGQVFLLLSTGINSPEGCAEFPLPAVTLSGHATLKIIQLPLEGKNKYYDKRTAQLQTVFPQSQIIPSANVTTIFSADAGALAKR